MKYCPNCGKAGIEGMKFCPQCGQRLIQASVVQSDINPQVKASAGLGVGQGIRLRPRSAALKWGTGLLFVLVAIYLVDMIGIIMLLQAGYDVPFMPGDFIVFFLALPAAIFAATRKHWRYVRGVTIWLPIASIIGALVFFAGGETGIWLPEDIAFAVFVVLAEITCLILISRTKTEFS